MKSLAENQFSFRYTVDQISVLNFLSVRILYNLKVFLYKFFSHKFCNDYQFVANLYCICINEHETCAYADAVHICDNIFNA